MLIALVALVGMLLTGEFSWLASDTSHVTARQTPTPVITPEEPFTLTLALIGMGTIAAYLAVSRLLWRRREKDFVTSEVPPVMDVSAERPSRGAA